MSVAPRAQLHKSEGEEGVLAPTEGMPVMTPALNHGRKSARVIDAGEVVTPGVSSRGIGLTLIPGVRE